MLKYKAVKKKFVLLQTSIENNAKLTEFLFLAFRNMYAILGRFNFRNFKSRYYTSIIGT